MLEIHIMNNFACRFSMPFIVTACWIAVVALTGCGKGNASAEMDGYISSLRTGDTAKKLEALTALSQIGAKAAPATQALVETLKDADPLNRSLAATILGQIGQPAAAALPALREMIKDSDPEVAKAAYNGIRGIAPDSPEAKAYMPNVMTPTRTDQ
jgi:HEAT repeat protein